MRWTSLFLVSASLVLGGCTMGPDYERPWTAADDEPYVNAPEAPESPTLDPDALEPWWQSFADPVTSDLVEQALAANTDLRAAAARVLEAQAGLRQARSTRFPEIGAGVGQTESENSFVLPNVGRVTTNATTYSTSLNVAYQVDLFGGLSRGRQAAWSDLLAREAARDTVAHTVVAEVVRARVRLATLDHSLGIARAIRDSWQDTADKTERRYESGLVSTLELRLARENLHAAEARVLGLEGDLASAGLILDVLVGQRPGSGDFEASGLAPLPSLNPVPLGLPADLLERRPDIRSAEMGLRSATARVGVAMADLFPGLTLSGTGGTTSDTLDALLNSESFVFNVVANLVGNVFDGGRRRAGVDAAEARAEEAAANYAGTVLTALREVEDALVRDHQLRRQLESLEKRLEEARAADSLARQRYERGVLGLLSVLETERRLRNAEDALVNAQATLWNVRIDLHLALGGNWRLSGDNNSENNNNGTQEAP